MLVLETAGSVGQTARVVPVLWRDDAATDARQLLRTHRWLRGIVVRDGTELRLLTRSRLARTGHGTVGQLSCEVLALPAEAPRELALRAMLRRPEHQQDDDAVVTWDDGQIGLVSLAALLPAPR